jgi:arginyl-tRNA synthetase
MIKFVGGEKMSSRTGNVLMASDIIESARKANTSASGKDDDRVAIGAIKYAFLKQRMGADIIYNPEESISLQGNSGPYIQYAHARARSILQKVSNSTAIVGVDNLDENERLLASTLADYPKTLTSAIFDITPHIICTYLYELSQAFNRFYENSKVVGSDRQEVRLELTRRYADTLKDGLSVLGIVAPDSM